MNIADALWKLIATGVIQGAQIDRAREVLEVSERELKAARARWECPDVPAPRTELVAVAEHTAEPYRWGERPAPYQATRRFTMAGRQRAAEKAFVSLRVERPRCAICGELIESGDVVVVSRAHHSSCAHKGRVA